MPPRRPKPGVKRPQPKYPAKIDVDRIETETVPFPVSSADSVDVEIPTEGAFDKLLIASSRMTSEELKPYWATLWPASVALTQYMGGQETLQDLRILEVGAGMAVPGLVSACKGAKVIVSDLHEDAYAFTTRNAKRMSIEDEIKFQALDWRNPEPWPLGEIDILMGADVLWYENSAECLARIATSLLQMCPGKRCIFASSDKECEDGVDKRQLFLDHLQKMWAASPACSGKAYDITRSEIMVDFQEDENMVVVLDIVARS